MTGDDPEDAPDEGWSDIATSVVPEGVVQATIPSGPEQAYLVVLSGSRVGEMVKVEADLVIGRDPTGFRIDDDGISRQHLTVRPLPGGEIELRDMGSLNGTFVNNRQVTRVTLEDGDKIRIGSTTILKFSYSDPLDKEFQQKMLQAAVRDALTGLYNRRRLMEQLELEFRYVQRHQTPLTVVMIDIDHFKRVNDSLGHTVGDAVLIGLAQLLQATLRGEDLSARYGGEEFMVLCRGIGSLAGGRVAERVRQVVEQARFVSEHPDLQVTISAGVASAPDGRFQSPGDLVAAADRALYSAKASGRNTVCIFN